MNWRVLKRVQMINKYMKKCSTSLVIKEMKIKKILRFHLSQSEWLSSRKQTIRNVGDDV
jgi:hypothetical protein